MEKTSPGLSCCDLTGPALVAVWAASVQEACAFDADDCHMNPCSSIRISTTDDHLTEDEQWTARFGLARPLLPSRSARRPSTQRGAGTSRKTEWSFWQGRAAAIKMRLARAADVGPRARRCPVLMLVATPAQDRCLPPTHPLVFERKAQQIYPGLQGCPTISVPVDGEAQRPPCRP